MIYTKSQELDVPGVKKKASWYFRMASRVTRLSNLGFFRQRYIRNKIWDVLSSTITVSHYSATFYDNSGRVQKYASRLKRIWWFGQPTLTDADDAKTLLIIPVTINYVIINQLSLNLVDICFDNMLQILCKSFAMLRKNFEE